MRKIDLAVAGAVHHFTPFSSGGTEFRRQAGTDSCWELVLHGNVIATFDQKGEYPTIPTYVNLCGYPSKTTCARLNALDGVKLKIKDGIPYLNGKEIEAEGWWNPRNGYGW